MGAAFNISLKIVFLFEMPKKASKDLRTTDSSEYSLTVKESIFLLLYNLSIIKFLVIKNTAKGPL